jgi:uncharacterized membrane protein required for colicin V production
MTLVNIIAALVLFFSFIGGYTQGAVKSFFSLIVFLAAIPVAGLFYPFFAGLLSFLGDQNWENFIGFFVTLAIASIILSFLFFLPRKWTEAIWNEGLLFRLAGGILNLLSTAVGLVLLTLVISAYPVWDWLQRALSGSEIIIWLVINLPFVQEMVPEIMRMPLNPV